ncbi:MAG: diguanylate cyclase [Magnetococcales bacterium]|nr:diguanylate cyclase [Magnetococcales bacterium]MBF0155731.1 diguanylate cyclase [Magnetococcales bacterium]
MTNTEGKQTILLPETRLAGALKLAEKIGANIMSLGIPHRLSETAPVVTASLGVATARPCSGSSPATLWEMADRMLYLAKQEGRNRVRGEALTQEARIPASGAF